MKRIWITAIAAILLLAFTGCARQVTHTGPAVVTKQDAPPVAARAVNPGLQRASIEMLETGQRKWRVGQMKQAKKFFAKAVEKNPYNFEAHYWLAMTERDDQNWERASNHFAQALQYCPKGRWESKIRVDWGLTYEQQGHKGLAAKQYDLALLADPTYRDAETSRRRVMPLPNASYEK